MSYSAADLPEALLCAGKRHRRSRGGRAISVPMTRSARSQDSARERVASQGPRAHLPAGEALEPVLQSCAAVEAAVLANAYKRSLKNAVEVSQSAPTTAPPSAEPSPALSIMKSDTVDDSEVPFALPSPAWPSVQEAVIGWDFCQADVEANDDSYLAVWSQVPEAAISCPLPAPQECQKASKESEPDWCLVMAREPATVADSPKASYADLVRGQLAEASPPAAGVRTRRVRCRRGKMILAGGGAQHVASASQVEEDLLDDEPLPAARFHGWKKEHKASRNTKVKRKVEEQRSKRVAQSWTSRGWNCGSEEA